jgi:hypothetical protein
MAATILFVAGAAVLTEAAYALQRQAAQLDPSRSRFEATGVQGIVGAGLGAAGLVLLLVFGIVFLVGSNRARRRDVPLERAPGVAAGASGLVALLTLLFILAAPVGPLQVTLGTVAGGGAHAVEVRTFEGNLTAATVNGVPTKENTHTIDLVARSGAIRVRMVSGGQGASAHDITAVAILEAPDGSGGWREVTRTSPTQDSAVDVPAATYLGDLRARVQVADGAAGQVRYALAFSFAPS